MLVLPIAGGFFAAVVSFGIAQVIEYVAKIEYHTSSQKNEAVLRTLQKIEEHLQAIRERSKE